MAEMLAESDREYGKTQSLLLFVDTWMFHKLCAMNIMFDPKGRCMVLTNQKSRMF
jgi:hypothetical protein